MATATERDLCRIPPPGCWLAAVTAGTLTETDGGVLLQARANDLKGAAVMLAGLGGPLTVRRPAELRDEVRALSDRLRSWSS